MLDLSSHDFVRPGRLLRFNDEISLWRPGATRASRRSVTGEVVLRVDVLARDGTLEAGILALVKACEVLA